MNMNISIKAGLALCAAALEASSLADCEATAEAERDDYAFLVKYMPDKDRGKVSEDYLRRNVRLAREALAAAPWRDTVPEDVFREYILPYSSVNEDADDWRAPFREKFWPLVKDCRTTGEAVKIINANIGKTLGVYYSTRRDKPDQSPFHSMRIGMASCTGLAILQIDAFRSCGIPARFTGCNWTPIPGNHSWAEYYDNGTWHFFNDPADGKIAEPDKSWFAAYAAQADASVPRTRIYAARWSRGGTWFWYAWKGIDAPSPVPADDVTKTYRRFRADLPSSRVAFVALDENGRRVPTEFRLVAPGSGKVMAEGVTYDETHDANDHVIISLPEHTMAVVYAKDADGRFRPVGNTEFGSKQRLFTIRRGVARRAISP